MTKKNSAKTNPQKSVLKFPCSFPVKIIGYNKPEFAPLVLELVGKHFNLNQKSVSERPSSDGKYLALTATVRATSKKKLDALYQELSQHKAILMVL